MGCRIRVWIGIMVFLASYVNYSARMNMSISIITMNGGQNKSIPECSRGKREAAVEVIPSRELQAKYGRQYSWDEYIQGLILGSYFWGYLLTALSCAWIVDWVGPFHTIFWAHLLTAAVNYGTIYAVRVHYGVLIATRVVVGLCAGVVHPALQRLITFWAPPAEKKRFVSALMGNTVGTCLTWPLVALITESYGWAWGFHFVSIQIAVFCLLFCIVTTDTPGNNRWISEEENDYIWRAQKGIIPKRPVPPYKHIFTSLQFWVLAISHFGNLWGLYLHLTGVPKFLFEVVGLSLINTGLFSALPQLARTICGIIFAAIGVRSRRQAISKVFVLFSHILPGAALIALSFLGCKYWKLIIVLLTLSLGLNGAVSVTSLQNSYDLSPQFADVLFGLISWIGGTTGFITPLVTGYFIHKNNGIKEWAWNFRVAGGVYIATGLIFLILSSSQQQYWNREAEDVD